MAFESPLFQKKRFTVSAVFHPENLLRETRRQKSLPDGSVPAVCVLVPDGDGWSTSRKSPLAAIHHKKYLMQFTPSQSMPSHSHPSYIVSPRLSAGNRLPGTIRTLAVLAALASLTIFSPAHAVAATAPTSAPPQDTWRGDAKPIKVGIIIHSTDAETVWNAFRFGGFALKKGDSVKVFLLAKGVDCEKLNTADFDVTGQMKSFVDSGGKILACGTCLTLRNSKGTELCPISTMKDMYDIVKGCDKVLTF